ncbi:hypothetical protein B1A_13417, partial [mine drainage metagenome]
KVESETPTPSAQYTDWLDAVNAEPQDDDFVEVIKTEPEMVADELVTDDVFGAQPEPVPEPELPPTPRPLRSTPSRPPEPVTLTVPAPPRRVDIPESLFTQARPSAPTNERRGKVVAVFAGKGGVGKSTSMLSLAERAATVVPGLRVITIDANRGQGDLRTFLKLDDAGLPSIYDAAVS